MRTGRNVRVFVRQWNHTESERWRRRRWRCTCEPDAANADSPAVTGAAARRGCRKTRRHHKAARSETPQREEKILQEPGGDSLISIGRRALRRAGNTNIPSLLPLSLSPSLPSPFSPPLFPLSLSHFSPFSTLFLSFSITRCCIRGKLRPVTNAIV